jgi:putative methyltransferase (TIGR04325 family)
LKLTRWIQSLFSPVPPPTRSPPEWEYVAEGWDRLDPAIKGWQVSAVLETYLRNWKNFCESLAGHAPLDLVPDSFGPSTGNPILHNIVMTYGYVLGRASRRRERLSVLDWGGNLGHHYLLARALIPDLELEYHCKDLPLFTDAGRGLLPEVHFHSDEACLSRAYDLVMASSSLQYSPDWRATLRQLARATGGYLYLTGYPVVSAVPSFVILQRPYAYGFDTEYLGWCLNRSEVLQVASEVGLKLVREFVVGHAPPIHCAPEQNHFWGCLFKSQ